MNILVISHLFPNYANKTYGIFAARQFAALQKMGAKITIFVPVVWVPSLYRYFRGDRQNYELKHRPVEYEGLRTITVPYFQLTRGFWSYRWAGLCVYMSMKNKAIKLHSQSPFDIIYGKSFFPDADAAVRLSKVLRIPAAGEGVGSDVHVAPNYSPSLYRHFVKVATLLDGALADGKGVAEIIGKVSGKQVPTIHGLVDLDEFAPVADKKPVRHRLNLPLEPLIILYVGSLGKAKGIYEMVDAFCQAQKVFPNMILKICGSGEERPLMEKFIAEKGIENLVQLVGVVDSAQINQWMKASDLFVLASYSEGMPNVVMEAMACGLPVVTTSVGGLPEAIGDCPGAVLVPPKNVPYLTEAILKIARDKNLREKMCIASRKRAEEKFGIHENSRRTLEYLRNVIERHEMCGNKS